MHDVFHVYMLDEGSYCQGAVAQPWREKGIMGGEARYKDPLPTLVQRCLRSFLTTGIEVVLLFLLVFVLGFRNFNEVRNIISRSLVRAKYALNIT